MPVGVREENRCSHFSVGLKLDFASPQALGKSRVQCSKATLAAENAILSTVGDRRNTRLKSGVKKMALSAALSQCGYQVLLPSFLSLLLMAAQMPFLN